MRRLPRSRNGPRVEPTLLGTRIPLVSLRLTLAVAHYLNFHHAAKALGVSQSSVSARVKALEEDLGTLLFERHARGVRLARVVLHRDPVADETRTRRCWESHLARAQWMTKQGYRRILEQAIGEEHHKRLH
ncbi:LysR family transcriptional regulator [Aquamicrobium segne]|uniref:LysR family transcriptional regulator n=1 Tax=Aquamicrobium segne TaxID=469547 RepID=A0ABW0GUX6_9HYPH